jgi:mannose-6-phosphate isomerase-like protein (cupin superfamily)
MLKNTKTAEHYQWGEACDGWRLLDHPDLTVIQERMPAGETEVKHVHLRARQLFYVLRGRLQIDLDGTVLKLGPGDAVEVAPGQSHRVRNTSTRAASLLVVSSPSTGRDREEREPLPQRRRPAAPRTGRRR